MSGRELRRDLAVLPMSVVRELTGLTDRQVRYYDQQGLVEPQRGAGKQRRFSLEDVDRLLQIAEYLDAGYTVAEIREVDAKKLRKQNNTAPSEESLRHMLADELLNIGRFNGQQKF
ncbi:MerR family transcriptional regulator [Weissella sagaensis]|jgi:MerR family glutamine synthetase transcriptional repressor|uniref:MerR family transcriptional regulator n=1 Tax=Weissella sagaensis TaxID=2559928 RepID=A0ABW1RU52_9LACO|nr:MerR family transcriptional regulator [Weissella sagaensis]KAA8433304.1 MerR family transcriptional regulator [Weissella paramesenteroides]MBU7567232.1 MerR family transcriptional regulator [Weissella hellenica]KAA8439265.1 MerR family transcriptional regulator [Weissella paramesenteroides]QDJ59284.1 MerR family transcriptional regulator [Weissella hellenica]UEG67407.1 MerR family transcriptional regulator [Weissella hellenica]